MRSPSRSTNSYSFEKPLLDDGTWIEICLFGAFAVFAALHEYLPPATFSAQTILFFINLPLLALCAYLAAEP